MFTVEKILRVKAFRTSKSCNLEILDDDFFLFVVVQTTVKYYSKTA